MNHSCALQTVHCIALTFTRCTFQFLCVNTRWKTTLPNFWYSFLLLSITKIACHHSKKWCLVFALVPTPYCVCACTLHLRRLFHCLCSLSGRPPLPSPISIAFPVILISLDVNQLWVTRPHIALHASIYCQTLSRRWAQSWIDKHSGHIYLPVVKCWKMFVLPFASLILFCALRTMVLWNSPFPWQR